MSSTPPSKSRVGRVLVERGIITEDQLSRVLAQQEDSGGRLGELLVAE
jgi:hypothetical protein